MTDYSVSYHLKDIVEETKRLNKTLHLIAKIMVAGLPNSETRRELEATVDFLGRRGY